MTNEPETVAVPVELIKMFDRGYPRIEDGRSSMVEELVAFLPKPKPRLVAFDYGKWMDGSQSVEEYRDAQPDLLTLLDDVCDHWGNDHSVITTRLKERIRTALGVTE